MIISGNNYRKKLFMVSGKKKMKFLMDVMLLMIVLNYSFVFEWMFLIGLGFFDINFGCYVEFFR